jgi:aspartate ammonia-lyase
MITRTEKDHLGELKIPADVLWGIHTARAMHNFHLSEHKVSKRLVHAFALTKKACCIANAELGFIPEDKTVAIIQACDEIASGMHDIQFPVDALQGGAGTSTNMNVNEVIANRALEILGHEKGDYKYIHPIDTINLHQSTNDAYPTALKAAAVFAIRDLSESVAGLQGALQQKEKEFSHILTIGRTELQDAVPVTLGSMFGAAAEAFARDRWRTFKCEERLRVVNLGGTAVGTGLTAPRKYIFLVIEKLRQVTGLGLMRAELPQDATANADVFTEVSGILNGNAVNIRKLAMDLRLLHYFNEIHLPAVQAGSSIMPGKVNPVIMEASMIAAIKVLANDKMINDCVSTGTLQINEFLPLVSVALLENIDLLINTNEMLKNHILGIIANEEICRKHFEKSHTLITAFLPEIGYAESEKLIEEFELLPDANFRNFLNNKLGMEVVDRVLAPENLVSLGYK